MADMRDRVKKDRGLIKNIELAIPGFRGYRKREDLRIADSMLRLQLADKLKEEVKLPLEGAKEAVAKALNLDMMNDISDLVSKVDTLEAKIRHAEQGYSGISPNYRIGEDQLNVLYEYDWSMINIVHDLADDSQNILSSAEFEDFSGMKSECIKVKKKVLEFGKTFRDRHNTMADLGAF
ncbi:hypothetical protein F1737_03930 [Methanoplanus sp. FWC-SCC4]|uniref:Uncharacterized protein n=1 Tax=Methanochimaera problematica TaxID=2609417 RepID=A0AA97FCW1_9EURY|nr:hypothetical protein [Methanoplanus sp. FWC-SCC4]WOF15904.1 hypothetical protein F1737_03930 [Methanoplanus sp. FWC-SCC4]